MNKNTGCSGCLERKTKRLGTFLDKITGFGNDLLLGELFLLFFSWREKGERREREGREGLRLIIMFRICDNIVVWLDFGWERRC